MKTLFAHELNAIIALPLNGRTGNVRGVVAKRGMFYGLETAEGYKRTTAREAAHYLAGNKTFAEVQEYGA